MRNFPNLPFFLNFSSRNMSQKYVIYISAMVFGMDSALVHPLFTILVILSHHSICQLEQSSSTSNITTVFTQLHHVIYSEQKFSDPYLFIRSLVTSEYLSRQNNWQQFIQQMIPSHWIHHFLCISHSFSRCKNCLSHFTRFEYTEKNNFFVFLRKIY